MFWSVNNEDFSATNRLEDERKASKQKTKELEEKIEQLLGELATAEAELKKERRELGVERKHLADWKQKYEELKQGGGYCGHPCTIPSCVQEKAKNLLKEPSSGRKVATEKANSNLSEESCRPCAGIREDVQEVYKLVSSFKEGQDKFERLLTEQQQRCNDEKKEMREQFQRKLDDRREQITTLQLENNSRCKEETQAYETLRAELKSAKSKEREMVNEIYRLRKELERQQYEQLSATECHWRKCASMAQKVEELEIVVEKQSAQLNKRFTLQPDFHDGLILEYQKLLANYEILKLVEGCFTESFDAKGFLSDIFMVYTTNNIIHNITSCYL
jgi:predicted  nucleic acid-binding Zn-ribbon protein